MLESRWNSLKSFPPALKVATFFFFLCFAGNSIFPGPRGQVDAAAVRQDGNNFLTGGFDSKSLFYIYEWPSYLDDVWPPQNATLHQKSGYDHGFYENRGAGKPIDADVGLFQTWQFSLYKNLMARLRTSEFRTKDPSKAKAFIIPFDLGVHSYIDHLDGHPRLAAPHGRYAGRYLRSNCQGAIKDLWWKNNGHDHFLIFSITAYQMVGMQVKELFMFVCQNCTVITIETTPTGTAPPGRTRKHWFAAPYPSSFHYHEGIKELPWELPGNPPPAVFPPGTAVVGGRGLLGYNADSVGGLDARTLRGGSTNNNNSITSPHTSTHHRLLATSTILPPNPGRRDILSLFIGSVRTAQASSRALRTALFNQCKAEGSPSCEWRTTPHSCNGVVNASDSMLLFRRAVYCPAPAGDSLTRKSLFDSLVAGCIPVLFSRASLTQYKWHLSQEDVDNVAVYIPMSEINDKGANFISILKDIPQGEVERKQSAIRRLAPSLQYSIVPPHIEESKGHVWSPPFRDAAAVIIERILDRDTIQPIGGYTWEELKQLNLAQKHLSETHEDYATMRTKEKNGGKQKSAKDLEDSFLDKAITKISTVCEGTNIYAWGPQGSSPPKKKEKNKAITGK